MLIWLIVYGIVRFVEWIDDFKNRCRRFIPSADVCYRCNMWEWLHTSNPVVNCKSS